MLWIFSNLLRVSLEWFPSCRTCVNLVALYISCRTCIWSINMWNRSNAAHRRKCHSVRLLWALFYKGTTDCRLLLLVARKFDCIRNSSRSHLHFQRLLLYSNKCPEASFTTWHLYFHLPKHETKEELTNWNVFIYGSDCWMSILLNLVTPLTNEPYDAVSSFQEQTYAKCDFTLWRTCLIRTNFFLCCNCREVNEATLLFSILLQHWPAVSTTLANRPVTVERARTKDAANNGRKTRYCFTTMS